MSCSSTARLDISAMSIPGDRCVFRWSVMSLVLLDGWLFPPNQRRPGKARQIDEATRMLLYGVTGGA